MTRKRRFAGLVPGLLLASLLVGAQFAAALHAFAHDLATPQNPVCQACTAASHLGAANVASETVVALPMARVVIVVEAASEFLSALPTAPRQRGPPASS